MIRILAPKLLDRAGAIKGRTQVDAFGFIDSGQQRLGHEFIFHTIRQALVTGVYWHGAALAALDLFWRNYHWKLLPVRYDSIALLAHVVQAEKDKCFND